MKCGPRREGEKEKKEGKSGEGERPVPFRIPSREPLPRVVSAAVIHKSNVYSQFWSEPGAATRLAVGWINRHFRTDHPIGIRDEAGDDVRKLSVKMRKFSRAAVLAEFEQLSRSSVSIELSDTRFLANNRNESLCAFEIFELKEKTQKVTEQEGQLSKNG